MPKGLRIEKLNYYLFFIFLTLVPVTIFQGLLETWYIKEILDRGLVPQAYQFLGVNSYLSPIVKLALLIIGLILGYSLGQKNWRRATEEREAAARKR